jgi:hypothetical protein
MFSVEMEVRDRTHDLQAKLVETHLNSLFPNISDHKLRPFVQELITLQNDEARKVWEAALDSRLIPEAWRADSVAQSIVADEIAGLHRQLDRAKEVSRDLLVGIDSFAERYRRHVRTQHGKLRPQTLQDVQEIAIDSLYVEPDLIPQGGGEQWDRTKMLSSTYRAVLLGNPGGGKSTFASKLCYDICSRYEDDIFGGRRLTPMFVVLRDYGRQRKENNCSITDYIISKAKSDFQLEVPDGAFRLLLLTGRAVVIFDGLDELIETKDRLGIKSAVESFILEYPSVPILVTSREVGYEQAPLDKNQFSTFRLAAFDYKQVEAYATKWFALTRTGSGESKKITAAFIKESSVVPDIRSNPLMLGLLCNLYRQDGYLPKNRPEVYHRCADLLFTKWDRHRGIKVSLPMEHKLRPAMGFLANWIYANEQLQAGVSEAKLIEATASYLGRWREEQDEAHAIAKEFVEFFKGRAWVFSDTGSNRNEPLYQFTHRTFLEYFTAENLVKTHPTAAELHGHLLPRIVKREWDVVCQLAYQLIAERTESHDVLVGSLIEAAENLDGLDKLHVCSFMERSLDLLYPTPVVRREALKVGLYAVLSQLPVSVNNQSEHGQMIVEVLDGVMRVPHDVLAIHTSEVRSGFLGFIGDDSISRRKRIAALETAADLNMPLHLSGDTIAEQELLRVWDDVSGEILNSTKSIGVEWAKENETLAIVFWWEKILPIEELVSRFGLDVLFRTMDMPLGWMRISISEYFIDQPWTTAHARPKDEWRATELGKLKPFFSGMPLPWLNLSKRLSGFFGTIAGYDRRNRWSWPAPVEQREALLCCIACTGELRPPERTEDIHGDLNTPRSEAIILALSHSQPSLRTAAHKIVDKLAPDEQLRAILHDWIAGELDLVGDGNAVRLATLD